MVSNNEAVENFLNGKRNLAAFQFNHLIKETTATKQQEQQKQKSSPEPLAASTSIDLFGDDDEDDYDDYRRVTSGPRLVDQPTTSTAIETVSLETISKKQHATVNCDEIAFNYAMINLFTGCPTRASLIFNDLVKRYPRNPRLWLRLAESMLAAERSKMADEFEHIQQLVNPHLDDHLVKTNNRPILIKINPNYCHQQKSQQSPNKAPRETSSNFLVTIKGYLQNSLDLINEYNDISLLTDDNPSITSQSPQLMPTPTNDSHTSTAATATAVAGTAANSAAAIAPGATTSTSPAATMAESTLAHIGLSKQLSYANPYKSISRSALYHLRIKVQLNLAYICLCMGEPLKALTFTTQCLKSSPQGYEKVLACLYHAEACVLATRVDEAIQFLNLEVLNMAKNLTQEHPSVRGGTKQRVVYEDAMQSQIDRGTLAAAVTYNLSVAYAAKGEFINAQKILTRCLQPNNPIPMQLIICLLYIQLQLGQIEAAKQTILSNLPQFR